MTLGDSVRDEWALIFEKAEVFEITLLHDDVYRIVDKRADRRTDTQYMARAIASEHEPPHRRDCAMLLPPEQIDSKQFS